MTAKRGILRDPRCEETNMAYKCKKFKAVIQHFMGCITYLDTYVC